MNLNKCKCGGCPTVREKINSDDPFIIYCHLCNTSTTPRQTAEAAIKEWDRMNPAPALLVIKKKVQKAMWVDKDSVNKLNAELSKGWRWVSSTPCGVAATAMGDADGEGRGHVFLADVLVILERDKTAIASADDEGDTSLDA